MSFEVCSYPTCSQTLVHRDYRNRIYKNSGGHVFRLTIERLQCPKCRRLHTVLPDFLVPFKHYGAVPIESVLDRPIGQEYDLVNDDPTEDIIEDSFRRAILSYGKFQSCYVDNGRQYISKHLGRTLAELGIQRIRAKSRTLWAKGCVESLNRTVSRFNEEAKAHKIKTLEELNHFWEIWLNEYYHNESHEGLKEYYISQGMKVTEGGVTPYQEWMRDSKPLVFIDVNVVAKAFMHYEKRRVDSGACIRVNGMTYEVTAALIGANVTVAYDPTAPETVTVIYPGIKPIIAKPSILGRLAYAADQQLFAVVTADAGCGKSTLIRNFVTSMPKDEYIFLYLSDSKLTSRWFYKGMPELLLR